VGFQESVPIQEVFEVLKSSPRGLPSDDGNSRLQIFGPNKLEEKKVRYTPVISLPARSLSIHDLINLGSHEWDM
jgi:hypothetical protein